MPTRTLVSSITCPHCWHDFPPAQLRFISEHESLRGDPVLGDAAQLRFLPSRFDAKARAVDPLGAARGIKHVLALLVNRLQVLAVYLIVDFFDDF